MEDDDDDFRASSDVLQQHRANIARFAERLGLNLNDESKSEIIKTDQIGGREDDQASYNKSDTSKSKIYELEQQMNQIDDFDSQKYKQKLQALSKTVSDQVSSQKHNSNNKQFPIDSDYMTFQKENKPNTLNMVIETENSLKSGDIENNIQIELIKRKYQNDLNQNNSNNSEELDWRKKLDQIKKKSGYTNQDSGNHQYGSGAGGRGTQMRSSYQKSSKYEEANDSYQDFNIKNILMKYSDQKQLHILNDISSSDNMTSFRSDLEPIDASSPKMQSLQRGNNILRSSDGDDETLARLKQKYLGSNSPEQQKDNNLRRSSEKLFTESMSQADYLKKSQELINSSLDDLLSNLKNKFHGLGLSQSKLDKINTEANRKDQNSGIQLRQSSKEKKYLNTQGSIDEEKNEDDSMQNSNIQRVDRIEVKKSRDSSLDESFKHSPRVLVQALKDSSPIQNKDSGKKIPPTGNLRKSQEKMSLPKSSENKSLLIDQFVKTDFQKQENPKTTQQIQNVVPNLNLTDLQNTNMNQSHQDNSNEQPIKNETQKFEQESTIQNLSLSESQIDISRQIVTVENSQNENTLEITNQQKQNREVGNSRLVEQSPIRQQNTQKQQLGIKKLTPLKSNKKQKLEIPKYDQAFNIKSQQFEEQDDDLYKRDFMDIQDTLKTIKQMNLLGSPDKDFQAVIEQELGQMKPKFQEKPNLFTYNSNGDDQHSLVENQEIDYNLSEDSDDENKEFKRSIKMSPEYNSQMNIPEHYNQQQFSNQVKRVKQQDNQVLEQLRAEYRKENRHLLEEDQISFMSSSDQSSFYHEGINLRDSMQSQILQTKGQTDDHLENNFLQKQIKPEVKYYSGNNQPIISRNNLLNDRSEDIVQTQSMEFRDQEIPLLMNMIPLAQSKLSTGKLSKEKSTQIQQQLMKVDYLMERLRYLNSLQ